MWVNTLRVEELPNGTVAGLKMHGQAILLARVNDEIFALKNECPHLGCTMHRGTVNGYTLTCPCHDWVFDVRSGEFTLAPEIKIPVYATKVEDGEILINLGGI